jgi:hypothetical protein
MTDNSFNSLSGNVTCWLTLLKKSFSWSVWRDSVLPVQAAMGSG